MLLQSMYNSVTAIRKNSGYFLFYVCNYSDLPETFEEAQDREDERT